MSEWWQQDACYKRLAQETKLHSSTKMASDGARGSKFNRTVDSSAGVYQEKGNIATATHPDGPAQCIIQRVNCRVGTAI